MHPQSPEFALILERLDRVEAQNCRLKRGGLVLLMLLGGDLFVRLAAGPLAVVTAAPVGHIGSNRNVAARARPGPLIARATVRPQASLSASGDMGHPKDLPPVSTFSTKRVVNLVRLVRPTRLAATTPAKTFGRAESSNLAVAPVRSSGMERPAARRDLRSLPHFSASLPVTNSASAGAVPERTPKPHVTPPSNPRLLAQLELPRSTPAGPTGPIGRTLPPDANPAIPAPPQTDTTAIPASSLPPVHLKLLGYVDKPGSGRQVVISDDIQINVVEEGRTFDERFQVLTISPTVVEIRDMYTKQTMRLNLSP
jgi:hypothetical protein